MFPTNLLDAMMPIRKVSTMAAIAEMVIGFLEKCGRAFLMCAIFAVSRGEFCVEHCFVKNGPLKKGRKWRV